MWVTRIAYAPRVVSRRFISFLAAGLIAAVFAVLGPLAHDTFAADAIWDGDTLTYDGNVYTP